jgi:hypothetical protein|tara:strand:+ start:170 stop:487 length:318 start_codon:yes stop_codon:yes gene_type:complete
MQQITKSTFKHSNAIEALLAFSNKINCGHMDMLPIEQRIGALYSGNVLIDTITERPEEYTVDELIFVLGMTEVINAEVNFIIQDPNNYNEDKTDINWGADFHEGA